MSTSLAPDHDLDHLRGALAHLPEDRHRVAVDGGAHVGTWTTVMADHFERVLAFEPCADYAARIPERDNVAVHVHALGAQMGRAELVDGEDNEGQTHLMPVDDPEGDAWIIALDSYRLEALDLLKLDVEGFEQPALQGAYATVERCRPWVLVELNDLPKVHYGQDPRGTHKRLRQWGYRPVAKWNKDHLYAP